MHKTKKNEFLEILKIKNNFSEIRDNKKIKVLL